MKTVTRMGPLSVAKLSGVMYAIFGFIAGIFIFLGSIIGFRGNGMGMFAFGLAAPVMMPVIYGIIGFLGGLVSAWVYNLVARYVGGVQMELTDVSLPQTAHSEK